MRRSRKARTERRRALRARGTIAGVVVLATALATVLLIASFLGSDEGDNGPEPLRASDLPAAAPAPPASGVDGTETANAVEVPDFVGKTLAEAEVLLSTAGIAVETEEDASVAADAVGDARTVLGQDPAAGTVMPAGMAVRLRVAAEPDASAPGVAAGAVVVIDPGHQSRGDSTPEPVGPGADESKPRVTGGTTGTFTRVPEYEVVLQISTNLKARLEAAGVTVVMTRTTNDVNVSISERAAIANDAGADLFVRVHADGNVDSGRTGIATLYPGENRWTTPIVARSRGAAGLVQESVIAATGAESLGTLPRTDLSGFNWSRVPTVLLECGFMTNPVEDRLLSSPHYQDKLAEGMANGIIAFLNAER
ncbi:MAG: N-acetylmuramoyl-L-alanine amidase [Anaerosomatales bacterium]|nr:N-acetylmuramoyl-L-alanine amidase [Anaerosomatales bacterium]